MIKQTLLLHLLVGVFYFWLEDWGFPQYLPKWVCSHVFFDWSQDFPQQHCIVTLGCCCSLTEVLKVPRKNSHSKLYLQSCFGVLWLEYSTFSSRLYKANFTLPLPRRCHVLEISECFLQICEWKRFKFTLEYLSVLWLWSKIFPLIFAKYALVVGETWQNGAHPSSFSDITTQNNN